MNKIELFEPLYRADISIIECEYVEFAKLIAERHPDETLYSWNESFVLEPGTDGYQFHVCGDDHASGEKFYLWVAEVDDYLMGHEIHHLAHDILFTRGIVYCSQSEGSLCVLNRETARNDKHTALLVPQLIGLYVAGKPSPIHLHARL